MGRMGDRLARALDTVGATLKRDKKHRVYELPNGRTFVVAATPSDKRAEQNALTELRAVAGVAFEERRKAAPEVRAERRQRPGRQGDSPWARIESPLAVAMRESGVADQALSVKVEAAERWIAELRGAQLALFDALAEIGQEQAAMRAEIARLRSNWLVRFASWLSPEAGRRTDHGSDPVVPAAGKHDEATHRG